MKRLKLPLAFLLLAAGGAWAQEPARILGTVTTEGGQPIAGANVVVVGTGRGALTDAQGRYVINDVPAGTHQVTASLIGYASVTQQVTVVPGGSATLDFQLRAEAIQLEEIVAVGYGTQRRRTVTGAVSSVSAQEIIERPTSHALRAIQGRVPGVDIINAGNKPGDGVAIRIRGVRSITANNDPLIVVDGVPIPGGIGDLNPADIVSIEVLKDAAATAIYGSRGANGVVLVTTKGGSGAASRPQVTMDASVSAQTPYALPRMMTPHEYLEMLQAAARYAGVSDDPASVLNAEQLAAYQAGKFTDWQELIRRTGVQHNYNLGMNGTSGNTIFNLSGNYFDQTGTAVGFRYRRLSGNAAVDHTMGRLRLGVSARLTHSLQETALGDGLWGAARQQTGFGTPYDENGVFITHPDGDPLAYNPLKAVEGVRNDVTRDRIMVSSYAQFRLMDGVDLRVNFGPDYTHQSTGRFEGPETVYPGHADRQAWFDQVTTFQYILDNLLQVNRNFGGVHHVDATLLYGIQRSRQVTANQRANQIPYDEALYYSLGQGQEYQLNTNLGETALQYYMGRVVYTLMDRYTVSVAVRRDGASQLAPGRKWVTFPSVGLAWQLGDEPFMSGLGFLSTLKLRGSYGVTGSAAIAPYQTQGALSRTRYNFGSNTALGYGLNADNPPNPNLTWEKTAKTNVGIDFGLLNERITGTVDWYRENTYDLLLRRTLPVTTGYSSVLENVGKTRNTGVEIALSTINLEDWHGLRWEMDVNWTTNKNEIVELVVSDTIGCPANARPCDLNNGWFVGQPVNVGGTAPRDGDANRRVWYDYKFLGIWQEHEAAEAAKYGRKPGQIKVADINGDGVISPSDKVILGNTYPKWTANIFNRFAWRDFDLSIQANIRWGYTIFNTYTPDLSGRYGQIATDYWTPEKPSTKNPAPNLAGTPVDYGDTRGYLDGSHWRIRNIQFGWTMPQGLARQFGAARARLYATVSEPYVAYDYDYFDPENGRPIGAPLFRTFLIGANVVF
ncbi:MAG TPA: TonB-dependent receptor [Longimicrobiales bacterium]